MNAMTPTIDQIIDSVITSLHEHVHPKVSDPYAKSVLLTIDNLLRHVALRATQESGLLDEDNRDLGEVLARMVALLAGIADGEEALASEIRQVRAELGVPAAGFPSLESLSLGSMRLRNRLDALLAALIAARDRIGEHPDYGRARVLAREYLARMLTRNAALIDPAFVTDRR